MPMSYASFLRSFIFRHALSASVAVFVAIFVNHYFSFSGEGWIVLVAFLVVQTTRGTPIRQGIYFLLMIMIAIVVSHFLLSEIKKPLVIDIILASIFVISSFLTFLFRPLSNKLFLLSMFFSLILLMTTLAPFKPMHLMNNRILDAFIGACIGMLSGFLVFPARIDVEFCQGLVPVLKAFVSYSRAVTEAFLKKNEITVQQARITVEKVLQVQQGFYPEWVYEEGLNPGLSSGFRFFLVTIERISEILFSMHRLTRYDIDISLLQILEQPVAKSVKRNEELFSVLIDYLSTGKIKETASDFIQDISELEKVLQNTIPVNLELLDISPDYVHITAFVRDIKDLRELLLQLIMALPTEK